MPLDDGHEGALQDIRDNPDAHHRALALQYPKDGLFAGPSATFGAMLPDIPAFVVPGASNICLVHLHHTTKGCGEVPFHHLTDDGTHLDKCGTRRVKVGLHETESFVSQERNTEGAPLSGGRADTSHQIVCGRPLPTTVFALATPSSHCP